MKARITKEATKEGGTKMCRERKGEATAARRDEREIVTSLSYLTERSNNLYVLNL